MSINSFSSPDKTRSYWWIAASNENPKHSWHWKRYFNDLTDRTQRIDWGGPEWIKSARSIANIEKMRKGDIVIAYQADEGIVGLARLSRGGYLSEESGLYDTFDLAASPTVLFKQPVPIRVVKQLPDATRISTAIAMNSRETVYEVTAVGFMQISYLLLAYNPDRRKQVEQFISKL